MRDLERIDKKIKMNEDYMNLIKYSEEFKNTLRKMNVECEIDGKDVMLRSSDMKDIESI